MKKLRFFSLIIILALLFACTEKSSVAKLEGSWLIDIDKTVELNPSLQGNTTVDAITKTMAVTFLEGMKIKFNTEQKTVSGKLFGLSFNGENFGVVEDNPDQCVLLILRTKISFIPQGDILTVKTEDNEINLIFVKEQKI